MVPDSALLLRGFGAANDSVVVQSGGRINVKSWPHTEPLQYTVGDTVRWRGLSCLPRQISTRF